MFDYGSGDELLDDVNADDLFSTRSKRAKPSDDNGVQLPNKRTRQALTHEASFKRDSIARTVLKRDSGYDDFRYEQASAI
ncbi:hypothetical protein F4824DRAFT_502376 [Ustulina deusta]|nr:hypothetical protein F4824DRAFT_502376 [Ustulina deusta]